MDSINIRVNAQRHADAPQDAQIVADNNDCVITVDFAEGCGFDTCVEACGQSVTFLSCIDCAAQGANLILIGNGKRETTFLHSILIKKELNVFGSRNAYTRDFNRLIELTLSGQVEPIKLVSAVYPMEEAPAAFDALTHNDGSLEKVLLRFAEPEEV